MNEKQLHALLTALHDLCGEVDQDPDKAWSAPMDMVATAQIVLTEEPVRTWFLRWKSGQAPQEEK